MANLPNKPADGPAFLSGGGAMGALMRSLDWAYSPLGPPESWPLPLRTTLRILLTTQHPVFLFWGPAHLCFYNDAYSRSLGPEKHPGMLGKPAREFWAEIWNAMEPALIHVSTGQGSTWHEDRLVPIVRNGRLENVYWTYSSSPIDDPSAPHGVGGVLVLCNETTEQTEIARRQERAQSRWQQLFQQAPGFVGVLAGPGHVIEFANPMFCKVVGSTDLIGKRVVDALPWAEQQGFVALLDSVYSSGKPYTARSARLASSTEVHYVDFIYQPIRNEEGEVSGVFVQGSDVSDRQQAEGALRLSANRLALACEATGLGIYDYNAGTGIITWDTRVRRLWGVPDDETITYEVFESGLHAEDRAHVRTQFDRALHPHGNGRFQVEYRVINRLTGVTRWVQANGQLVFEAGQSVRLVGTAQDITERMQADVRRSEFLATLGHELRNPLAPIANALALLRHQPLTPGGTQACELIDRQLKHMVRLLEDLLDVVRVSKGRIALRNAVVRLDEVLALALETAAPHVERGGHCVSVSAPELPVHVYADIWRLAQVFTNLLINACKYSAGPRCIELITSSPEEGYTEILVRDQGIGIAAEHLPNLFDMFSQIAPSLQRSEGGLGIGLSLAKGLVEAQGGSIEARSEGLGRGSEFCVRLPVVAALGDAGHTVPAGEQTAGRLAGQRVLVVDDNQDAASTLGLLLELEGATVSVAFDSFAALQSAETFQPDNVVLDIGLPAMNGYEVCRMLRLRPWARALRIIALTGWGQDGDRQRSREAGFDAHLVKPVDIDTLVQALLAAPASVLHSDTA